jgi:beta-xylosidase
VITPQREIYKSQTGYVEGSHVYKKNGWYYICNTEGGTAGEEFIMRSRNIYGPYERRLVIKSDMNYAGNGLHQGGFVDLPNGDSWFFLFQDHDFSGRSPILFPIKWEDEWPSLKQDNTTTYGKVQPTYGKPLPNVTVAPISPMHSDEFSSPTLNLEWQWSHNPDDTKWSLREREGFLRLHATLAPTFKEARNTLVKRIIGPAISGRTVIDLSNLEEGDITGLAIWNLPYAYIGIRKENGTRTPIMVNQGTVIEVAQPIEDNQIYLKVITNDQSFAFFYYSVDGEKSYRQLGNALRMTLSAATYLGSRFGLFCYHVGNGTSGYADFDYLRLESQVGPANHFNASEPITISYYDTEYNTTLQRSQTNEQTLTPHCTGAWVCFDNLNFGQGVNMFQVNASALPGQQGVIEIHRDRFDGELLGKCPVQDEKSEGFKIYNATIQPVNGVQKIYLVFTGGDGGLFIISNFKFLSQ